jgi:hypothetical protein
MIGNFQDGSVPGKMQHGSAWCFLDQKDGMEAQIRALSNMGLFSRFVGMVTDSRTLPLLFAPRVFPSPGLQSPRPFAPLGINVNAIAPGYMATDNTQALRDDPTRSRDILARIPAARGGTPDDLKGAVVFLASPAAAYVHGAVLAVDGGWLSR